MSVSDPVLYSDTSGGWAVKYPTHPGRPTVRVEFERGLSVVNAAKFVISKFNIRNINFIPQGSSQDLEESHVCVINIEDFEAILNESQINQATMTNSQALIFLADKNQESESVPAEQISTKHLHTAEGIKKVAAKLFHCFQLSEVNICNPLNSKRWHCVRGNRGQTVDANMQSYAPSKTEKLYEEHLQDRVSDFHSTKHARSRTVVSPSLERSPSSTSHASISVLPHSPRENLRRLSHELRRSGNESTFELTRLNGKLWKGVEVLERELFRNDLYAPISNSLNNILSSSFVQKIKSDTLDSQFFETFCVDDYIYLKKFVAILARLGALWASDGTQDASTINLFFSETKKAVDSEHSTLHAFLKYFHIDTESESFKSRKLPAKLHLYYEWQKTNTNSEVKPHVALAAFLPCLWIWSELAQRLKKDCSEQLLNEKFLYTPWILNNSKEDIRLMVDCYIAILYHACSNGDEYDKESVISNLTQAGLFEESIFRYFGQEESSPLLSSRKSSISSAQSE